MPSHVSVRELPHRRYTADEKALMRALVAFRAAINEALAASNWEWGMYCLYEAVRLYPSLGGSCSAAHSKLLRKAFEHVGPMIGGEVLKRAPECFTEVLSTLSSIEGELCLSAPELLRRPQIARFRRLRNEANEPYLRLLCAWACFAQAAELDQADVEAFSKALRSLDLARPVNRLRAVLGERFGPEARSTLSPTHQLLLGADAINAIGDRAVVVPDLAPFAESLLHLFRSPSATLLEDAMHLFHKSGENSLHEIILSVAKRHQPRPVTAPVSAPVTARISTRSAARSVVYRNHGRWRE